MSEPANACCNVVELRQYTTHPGRRDELIEVFDNHLVAPQEDVGMHIIGQFRDVDDPDAFIWMRGYPDMAVRRRALHDFYYGPVWRQHSAAANATMVDSDNVLLLQPDDATQRALHEPVGRRDSIYTLLIGPAAGSLIEDDGRTATFRTLDAVNDFPALPVRTDFDGEVRLVAHPDETAAREQAASVTALQVRVLTPTAGSALR